MTIPSKQDAAPKKEARFPIRTLLLEPDLPFRETLIAGLSRERCLVESCDGGDALTEKMTEAPADLVVMEWQSLGSRACSVLREIQRINPGAAVILTGDEPPVREVVLALKEGAFDFLAKPFPLEALEETIGQALENRRSFMEILHLSESLKRANRNLKIQKRKLLEEKQALKKWAEEMNLLNAMTQEVVATLDMETILKSAIRHIGELAPYDVIILSLREEKCRYVASKAVLNAALLEMVQKTGIPSGEESFRMEILASGSAGLEAVRSGGMETIAQDMCVGEGKVGEIRLGRFGSTGFGRHETQILSMAAGTLALALNNATAHRQVQSLATTDGLTGLLNKRTFETSLEKKFKTTARYQNPLSLILVDLDKFKEINDFYGHQTGDAVLREMAQILTRSLRDIDLPARYGGDELAIILPETLPEQAFFVAKRIKKLVESHPFRVGRETARITVSMGLASCPSPAIRRVEDLVEAADRALYAAKRGGRNRVESSAALFNHENVYLEAPAL